MIRTSATRGDRLIGEIPGRAKVRLPPRRILFVCDATVALDRLFAATLEIAKENDAALRGLCIIQHLPVAADMIAESSLRHDARLCRKMLSNLDSAAIEANVRMETEIVFGVSSEQIVRQVREFDIDLVVLPTKHVGFAARTLLRSIMHQTRSLAVTIMTMSDEGTALLAV